MRHDALWVLLVIAFVWLLVGYRQRSAWGYYGYGSGGLFLLIILALLIFGVI